MHYLEETRPQRPLMPQDVHKRAKVRSLVFIKIIDFLFNDPSSMFLLFVTAIIEAFSNSVAENQNDTSSI